MKSLKNLFEKESFELQTSKGQNILIDKEDLPILDRYSWHISKSLNTSYALTRVFIGKKFHIVSMHRLLMGLTKRHVDHANGNGLDNRKSNLRICTKSENMANTRRKSKHGFRGVSLNNANKPMSWARKWQARITVKGKRINLGAFDSAEEAARAYDKAAIKHFGAFAALNFPCSTDIQPMKQCEHKEAVFVENKNRESWFECEDCGKPVKAKGWDLA